jgi:hypothetical protein
MALFENPPWPRGSTFGGGATVASTDGAQYEGKEYYVADNDPTTAKLRTNRFVKLRIVRNNKGSTLTAPAKKILKLDLGGAAIQDVGSKVSDFTASASDKGYPCDEYISGNVVANDLFYIVVEGPAKCTTDSAGSINFTTLGTACVPGAGTAGLIVVQGSISLTQIQNAIGKSMESVNANSTDITIDVGGHLR